jgi:hypothetical protein
MADMTSPIAPALQYPEKVGTVYERKMAPSLPMNRGPLRFQEGVATDTDIPQDFQTGVFQGVMTPPGRPNHNANVYEKWPEETMKQRAHVGSAAWVESPQYLGEFAHGSFSDYAEVRYEQVGRDGGNQRRMNPASVHD